MIAEDEAERRCLVAVLYVARRVDVVRQLQLLVVLEREVADEFLGEPAERVEDALVEAHRVGVGREERRQVGGVTREHVLQPLRVEHYERDVYVVGDDPTALVDGVVYGQVEPLSLDLPHGGAVTQEAVAERERGLVERRDDLPQGGVEERLQRFEAADDADILG